MSREGLGEIPREGHSDRSPNWPELFAGDDFPVSFTVYLNATRMRGVTIPICLASAWKVLCAHTSLPVWSIEDGSLCIPAGGRAPGSWPRTVQSSFLTATE